MVFNTNNNSNVITNLYGKTGAEVSNIRAEQMAEIENNFNEANYNKEENKAVTKSISKLTGIGTKIDLKV